MGDLTINFHGFSLVPLLVGSIVLAIYIYLTLKRHQLISSTTGRFIFALRVMFLLCLTIIVMRPEIRWQKRLKIAPKVIIAVDDSRSIQAQRGFDRKALIDSLDQLVQRLSAAKFQVEKITFARQVEEKVGSFRQLRFDGLATDLAAVLKYFQTRGEQENIVGGIVVTDGVSTVGEDPLTMDYHLPFPLFALGVGDTAQIFDPRIVEVQLPSNARVDDTIEVGIEFIPIGDGKPLELFVELDGKSTHRLTVKTQPNEFIQTQTIPLTITAPGVHSFRVTLKSAQDVNPINNWVEKRIRVDASRRNIVLIDGTGSFESKFLKSVLSSDKTLNVLHIIQTPTGYLPSPLANLLTRRWDAVIFISYPNASTGDNDIASLRGKIIDGHVPVWLWISDQTELKKLKSVIGKPIIQDFVLNRYPESISLNWRDIDWAHPLLQNVRLHIGDERQFTNLPPLGTPFKRLKLAPDWQILLRSNPPAEIPLIAQTETAEERRLLFVGNDFWRWYFLTGQIDGFYTELVKSSIVWLADTLSRLPLIVNLNREILLTGEVLTINAQVFDLNGKPLPQAEVIAEINTPVGRTFKLPLQWQGKNYQAEYLCEQEGELKIKVAANVGVLQYNYPERSLQVTEQPVELLKVRQNYRLLNLLSIQNKGRILELKDLATAPKLFNYIEKDFWAERNIKLWRSAPLMALMLGLIVIEWILRRRYGFQ